MVTLIFPGVHLSIVPHFTLFFGCLTWEMFKNGSLHIKSSCRTQNRHSNPTGIGLDHDLWQNIQRRIFPTSNVHVGHIMKIAILWV